MEKVVGFPRRDLPRQSISDAEFSDIGRSERFLPGWYILPSAALGAFGIIAVLIHFIT